MRKLEVYIEIKGEQHLVGFILGENYQDTVFQYDVNYMDSEIGMPISISLPFQREPFSREQTRCFFESLLPEGFSRRAVANWIKTDERDYVSILAGLGKECLGAIKIIEIDEHVESHYERLSATQVKELAAEGATKSTQILMQTHLSLAGASGKVGLYYDEKGGWYLPSGNAPSTHIVKQSHVRLNQIVLNEQMCMLAARNCGIEIPESFIINLGNGKDEDVLYATKRYDREFGEKKLIDELPVPLRLHQEDFAQAMGIASEDKYERTKSGYLEKMFDLIRQHTSDPIREQQHFLERLVFNYLVGNTDCHIKNHALVYSSDLKSLRLSPAYDIVSTRIYRTSSDMSFYIGDEIDIENITRNSFINASNEIGIGSGMIENIYDGIANKFEKSIRDATDILESKGFKESKALCNKILSEAPL